MEGSGLPHRGRVCGLFRRWKTNMNSLERIRLTARGRVGDRVPVGPYLASWTARWTGISISHYCTDGQAMARAQLLAWEKLGHEIIFPIRTITTWLRVSVARPVLVKMKFPRWKNLLWNNLNKFSIWKSPIHTGMAVCRLSWRLLRESIPCWG